MATFIQAKSAEGISSSSVTTAAVTTTSGDGIILLCGNYPGDTNAATPVSDSKGNTWTLVGQYKDTAQDSRGSIFYCANIVGGASHTFTYSITTTQYPSISMLEFSSMASSGMLDVGGNTYFKDLASSGSTTSVSMTTLNASDVLIALVTGTNGGSTPVISEAGVTWTMPAAGQQSSGSGEPIFVGYALVSSTAAYAFSTTNPAGGGGTVGIASFKQASAGAPAYYPFRRYLHLPEWEV